LPSLSAIARPRLRTVLTELPTPAAENDVIVEVNAAGSSRGEPEWPGTWVDRAGRDRTRVLGHELSGVVVELGYGTHRPHDRPAGFG